MTYLLTDLILRIWAFVSSVLIGVILLAAANYEFEMLYRSALLASLAVKKVSVGIQLDLRVQGFVLWVLAVAGIVSSLETVPVLRWQIILIWSSIGTLCIILLAALEAL
jgi:hypothetical protein